MTPKQRVKRIKEISEWAKEMRIQLASDSTLKNLINKVDDMGDIKLIDTTVKILNKL